MWENSFCFHLYNETIKPVLSGLIRRFFDWIFSDSVLVKTVMNFLCAWMKKTEWMCFLFFLLKNLSDTLRIKNLSFLCLFFSMCLSSEYFRIFYNFFLQFRNLKECIFCSGNVYVHWKYLSLLYVMHWYEVKQAMISLQERAEF